VERSFPPSSARTILYYTILLVNKGYNNVVNDDDTTGTVQLTIACFVVIVTMVNRAT